VPISDGEFILYWTVTALRTEENPALDVACWVAAHSNLPLLVYHGLSERYPFASDRHHTFILQAARRLQLEYSQKKIAYAFHLESPSDRRQHLVDLANRAAVVVTEEMPCDPARSFRERLVAHTRTPIVAVDTACVFPMRLVGRAYTRAFQYRENTIREYDSRVTRDWPAVDQPLVAFDLSDLPFQPLPLDAADLSELVAKCEIDHSVGPVLDTLGGSDAGYQRWNAFKAGSLKNYHQRRNRAEIDGVSRMSAYLHYGMVSPMRIAREAAETGGSGAEKYVDELLIWRELSHAFCFYRRDHHSWQALPEWARDTLSQHQSDARPVIYDWEQLARGQTQDELWNACQLSLLRHGELHNNLRMTWGKAVLNWTRTPEQALQWTLDLNHRYALDGRDPSSYGGILWCLGQFDRPFQPAQPIFGTVRTRPTDEHARRIDLHQFMRRRLPVRSSSPPTIAVVGAGIAGLVAARTLQDHGLKVQVYEKSRGYGGRAATRRAGQFQYDHGAQYFTVRNPIFARYVQAWIEQGWIRAWSDGGQTPSELSRTPAEGSLLGPTADFSDATSSDGTQSEHQLVNRSGADLSGCIVVIKQGQIVPVDSQPARFVACPGMNAIGGNLASGLQVQTQVSVCKVQPESDAFRLIDPEGNALGQADRVILAVPAPQASQLLQPNFPELASRLSQVTMQPCWAVLVTFADAPPISWFGAFVHESPIAWISRNDSKPGRFSDGRSFVIHANPQWTLENFEVTADEVTEKLIQEFFAVTGIGFSSSDSPATLHQSAHRWRYSIAQDALDTGFLSNGDQRLIACGDWAKGSRIEGAFLSGMSAAGAVLRSIPPQSTPELPNQLTLF
jgi:photolyase PhrII